MVGKVSRCRLRDMCFLRYSLLSRWFKSCRWLFPWDDKHVLQLYAQIEEGHSVFEKELTAGKSKAGNGMPHGKGLDIVLLKRTLGRLPESCFKMTTIITFTRPFYVLCSYQLQWWWVLERSVASFSCEGQPHETILFSSAPFLRLSQKLFNSGFLF